MGINTENEVVQQLQAQGVEINTPDSVSVRDLIKDMVLHSDGAVVAFQSVEDKEQSIEFVNVIDDYVYPPETYCEVTAIEGEKYKVVGTLMDKGTKEPLLIDGKTVTAEKPSKLRVKMALWIWNSHSMQKALETELSLYLKNCIQPKEKVQTGDSLALFVFMGAGLVLLIGGSVLVFKKKKQ